MVFVFVTVMLDMLAFGVIIPVLPHLILELTGGNLPHAAVWSSAFATIFMLLQFLFSPVQGAMSDRYGRRRVILIYCLGLVLHIQVMANAPSIGILYSRRIISVICAASFTTANAYIADITPPEKRAASFGLMGAAFGIGFILGPAIGSLLSHWGHRAPFWAAAVLALANFIWGWFVLPESLPITRRSPRVDWRHANPFGALLLIKRYPKIWAMVTAFGLSALAQFAINSTYVLYTDYRFGWSAQVVGYSLSFVGLCSALVQAMGVRMLMPKLGERRLILIGLSFAILGYALFGLASEAWLFVLGIPFLCLGGLAAPPSQALLSHQIDPHEQGRLQGAISSLNSLAGIVGPALFANLFALFVSDHAPAPVPGIAFVLASVLLCCALFMAIRATRHLVTTSVMPATVHPGSDLAATLTGVTEPPEPQV